MFLLNDSTTITEEPGKVTSREPTDEVTDSPCSPSSRQMSFLASSLATAKKNCCNFSGLSPPESLAGDSM